MNLRKFFVYVLCLMFLILCLCACESEKATESDDTDIQQTEDVSDVDKEPEVVEPELEKQEISSDFKEAYQKKNDAYSEMNSFTTNVTAVVDVEYMGTKSSLNGESEAKISVEDMITHIVASASGEPYFGNVETELYAEMGEQPTVYRNVDGTWIKSSMSESDSAEIMMFAGKADTESFDVMEFMLNTSVSEELYNERECYKLSYDIEVRLYDIIETLGYEKEFKKMLKELDVPATAMLLIKPMLNDLGTVSVSEYVDVYTMYPVATEINATDCLSAILDKVATYAPMAIEDYENSEVDFEQLVIENFTVTTLYSDINETEVVIPKEVLEAETVESVDVSTIGGADGPTAIIVG